MKKLLPVLLMCLLLITLLPLFSGAISGNRSSLTGTIPDQPLPENCVDNQILVTMEQRVALAGPGANPNLNPFQVNLDIVSINDLTDISEFAGGHGAISPAPYQGPQILLVEISDQEDLLAAIATLESDPLVSYAEPNPIIRSCGMSGSPYSGGIWNYDKIGANLISSITSGSADVRIAIADSGINEHPALAGSIDYDLAWNFLTEDWWRYDSHEEIQDDLGHGTFVAGVAAGIISDDEGFVEKLSDVKLVPLKIFDGGGVGDAANFIRSLTYAESFGIDIFCFSGGYSGNTEPLGMKDAISSYSGTLIVAAGNNGTDISDPAHAYYPGSFGDLENVITVAASNQDDDLSSFSSYGMAVSLTAPGENVLNTSTYWSWSSESGWLTEYGFESWSGSSVAVPHVAFAAGLLKSLAPELTAAQIKTAILDNVDYCPSLDGLVQTEGRLNVYQALLSVMPANQPAAYFDDSLLADWQYLFSDADLVISCPITALVPDTYLITADLLDSWNYYEYPDSWDDYIEESIDKNEFLSGSDLVEMAFSEGVMLNLQCPSVAVIRIFDSLENKLAEEVCQITWLPPVK